MVSKLPQILTDREMSGFPLSIGTGLALEAVFLPETESKHEQSPEPLSDTNKYTSYVINIDTLVRNMISSLPSKDSMMVSPSFYYKALLEEIDYLEGLFAGKETKLILFVNDYSYYKNTYKDTYRKPNTTKQLFVESVHDYVRKNIVRDRSNIPRFSKEVKLGKEERTLLLSHLPVDLLSRSNFLELDLLESHTAVIKTRRTWNSKYYPLLKEDMTFLPFNEYLLTTFGDRSMFSPKPLKQRQEVYKHMVKLGVNPLSSELGMLLGR